MSYQRLAYDDAATTDQMATDCAAVDQTLHLGHQRRPGTPPHPVEGGHHELVVSDDLAALAAGLELHFD